MNDFLDYITIGYNIKSASQRLNLNLDCVKKLISVANKDPKYSSFFNDYSEAKNIRDKRRKKSTINK